MSLIVKDRYRTNKDRSKASERKLARKVGGRLQPASGAMRVAAFKGDVVTTDYMFDDKVTWRKGYTVTRQAWRKLQFDALRMGKQPVLRINFENGPTLFVMDAATFHKSWA